MSAKLTFVLIFVILGRAAAQELPDAPHQDFQSSSLTQNFQDSGRSQYFQNPDLPSHKYWDTTNKILLLTHAGLEAADFAITHHNIASGGTEQNPMGKSLCQSGTAGQLAFFGGRMAAVMGVSYSLHKLGLHKAERGFILYMSGDSAWGLSHSLANR